MKTLKFLSMLVFAVFLVSAVNAVTVYAEWGDKTNAISITDGDSVVFNADFISVSPPMTINIKLYDSQSNLVYSFEDNLVINTDCAVNGKTYSGTACYFPSITIDQTIYNIPGQYELILSGNDATNLPQEKILSLTVNPIPDTNAPIVEITNPVDGATYDVQIDTLSYTADDAEGNLVDCRYTDGSFTSAWVACSGTFSISTQEGQNTFTVEARDSYGNVGSDTVTFTIDTSGTSDTTAPVITLLGEAIVNVALGDTYADAGATAMDDVDGDITINIDVDNPVDTSTVGVYIITYTVSDEAGNPAVPVTRIVNVYDPSDTTAPVITVITPKDGKEYDKSELTFKIEVDKIAEVTFVLDNEPEVTMDYQGMSNGVLTFTYDVDLDDGDYKVKFYAVDAAGNKARKTIEFSIDTEDEEKDKNVKTIKSDEDEYYEDLYLDQFNQPDVIYLGEEDEEETHLNWWQRFVAWLKRIFGFD